MSILPIDVLSIVTETKELIYSDDSLPISTKLNLIDISHQKIMTYSKSNFATQACEYYYQMRKLDDQLQSICDKVVDELKPLLIKFHLIVKPTSSFESRTNISSSDLDFSVLHKYIDSNHIDDIGNELKSIGYVFNFTVKVGLPQEYRSYSKTIDGTEIEIKLRNKDGSEIDMFLHKYIQNSVPIDDKIHITYIKYLLQFNPVIYTWYKYISYDSCVYMMGERNYIVGRTSK